MLVLTIFLLVLSSASVSSLKQADEAQCNALLFSIFSNITTAITTQSISNLVLPSSLIENSGRGINDLGLYQACNKEDNSRYMLIRASTEKTTMLIGLCGPSVCEEKSYNNLKAFIDPILSLALSHLLNVPGLALSTKFEDPELQYPDLDAGGVFILILVCFLLLLCVLGTTLETYDMIAVKKNIEVADAYRQIVEEKYDEEPRKIVLFLKCFSLITNAQKVFSLKPSGDQNLDIFNGVRFLSMCWVVVGHTYLVRMQLTYNLEYLKDMVKTPGVSTVADASLFAVDIFFFLGGFFVAFVLIGKFNALKKTTTHFKFFGHIYFHRIYRIWPSYVLCIMILYKLSVYFWSGPVWGSFKTLTELCDDKWWTNLLYIDNLFGRHSSQYCFAWGWYLSNDFQMFLVSPFLLFLYTRNKKLGLISMFSLLGLSFLASFVISFVYNLKSDKGLFLSPKNNDFFNLLYNKPWIRGDVYILGLLVAIFYLEFKKNETFRTLKRWLNNTYFIHILCYILGLLLINLIIWSVMDLQKTQDMHIWSDTQHVFYVVFNRFTFVLGFVFVILPGLLTGNDVVYKILSFKAFTPLGRLTYSTYLVHLIVISRTTYGTELTFYGTNESFLYVALVDTIISLIAGFVLSVVAEVPLLTIEKIFIFKEKKQMVKSEKREKREGDEILMVMVG